MGLRAFRQVLPNFGIIASCIPAPGLQVTITSPMYTFLFFLPNVALLAWLAGAFPILLDCVVVEQALHLPFTWFVLLSS